MVRILILMLTLDSGSHVQKQLNIDDCDAYVGSKPAKAFTDSLIGTDYEYSTKIVKADLKCVDGIRFITKTTPLHCVIAGCT